MTDNDLANIARAVYRKHRAALDFIFEHRPDRLLEISELAAKLASDDSRIKVVHPTKSYIRFFPKAWEGIPAFNATPENEWTQTGHSLLFEIKNTTTFIRMTIVIGPTEEDSPRRDILDFSRKNRRLFQGGSDKLTSKFTQIYSRNMVDRHTLERQPIEDIESRVESEFRSFMDKEFDEIVDALTGAFTGAGTG